MISRRKMCQSIDDAAAVYSSCWETLSSIKSGNINHATVTGIARFQHDLARTLVKLDRVYIDLGNEKKSLIARKPDLRPESFDKQMARRSKYQHAIEEAMRIGKILGDNFAWLFYMREPELIERHLQHPGNLHMPSGVGAIGELAFTSNIKPFNDQHIVIYHGTTTFLRIGDVSFIHLPTHTVTALGELKSRESAAAGATRHVEISLSLIGDAVQMRRRMPFLPQRKSAATRRSARAPLPPAREAQLKRQIKRMSAALDGGEPDRRVEVRQQTNVLKLEDLASDIDSRHLSHIKVDDGLTIVGFRLSSSRARLSSRLLPRKFNSSTEPIIANSPEIAMDLIDASRKDNALLMSGVTARYLPGMTPLFWSPLRSSVLKALTFQEIYCATWFNPVHLVKKLEVAGLSVTTGKNGIPIAVGRPTAQGTISARITPSTILLITQHLVTEATFVKMLQRVITTSEKYASMNVELMMPIIHYYDALPPAVPKRHRRRRSKSGGA